ncbi:MAG: hypothetical protein IJS21_04845 [Deltaproteobacteria bacterium]|nr:hypothetical protein [Deltaproteobacteria bacterium]
MEIKAVKSRTDAFYSQPFVFGGEESMDPYKSIRYRGSLQNDLIDTGNEVILVDTGLPAGTPEDAPDDGRCPRRKQPPKINKASISLSKPGRRHSGKAFGQAFAITQRTK